MAKWKTGWWNLDRLWNKDVSEPGPIEPDPPSTDDIRQYLDSFDTDVRILTEYVRGPYLDQDHEWGDEVLAAMICLVHAAAGRCRREWHQLIHPECYGPFLDSLTIDNSLEEVAE